MSDFDLDRLGDLWRAQPDPKEMERLQRAAAAAARRARWGQVSDVALAAIVSAAVLALVWTNPTVRTALVGGAAILVMLASTMRQRQLRKVELEGLTGTTEQMLDQSIGRLQAGRKRAVLSLAGLVPGAIVGVAFAATLEGGTSALWAAWRENENLDLIAYGLAAAAFVLLVYLAAMLRRNRTDLLRLTSMRDAFRSENEAVGQPDRPVD